MLRYPMRTRVVVLTLASLALGAAFVSSSLAGKPGGGGGGGTPAGRIYYTQDGVAWSMQADGTDKQLTPYEEGPRTEFLSYRLHGGHRWYLEVRWSAEAPWEHSLFAVRDDGDPGSSVLLLNATDVGDNLLWLDTIRWGQDDSFISFTALATVTLPDGSCGYDPAGFHTLYAAEVVFDASGRPALTMSPTAVLAGETAGERDIAWYDWSPDGSQVAYDLWSPPGSGHYALKIADRLTGQIRLLAAESVEPAWSPYGSRIAFRDLSEGGICTIRPDGSGELRLTNSGFAPVWSPDGKHIAYTSSASPKNVAYDVFRVSASGGSAVNLTRDISGDAGVHPGFGWR
jgi:hypothetical protein